MKIIPSFMFIASAMTAMAMLTACSGSNNRTQTAESTETATVDELTQRNNVNQNKHSNDAESVIALAENSIISPADKPIIIDFSATWCGPCKQFQPIYHEVADENNDFIFYSVDVDDCSAMAQEYGIQSIPQVWALMPDGRKIQLATGFMDKAEFLSTLAKLK